MKKKSAITRLALAATAIGVSLTMASTLESASALPAATPVSQTAAQTAAQSAAPETLTDAERAAVTADPPWSGFAIAKNRTASGYWLGGRWYKHKKVYRLDPGRKTYRIRKLSTPRWTAQLKRAGRKAVTKRDTTRAAWILSQYGAVREPKNNAAVDISLGALLWGGPWSANGWRTKQRMANLSATERADITANVSRMLAESARYAGPYRVTAVSPVVNVGSSQQVNVTVKTSAGVGVPGMRVVVSYPGATAVVPARTDINGMAGFTFNASKAGPVRVGVRVGRMPETRLNVRTPIGKKGVSRIARAGMKETVRFVRMGAVRAIPKAYVVPRTAVRTTSDVLRPGVKIVGGYPQTRKARVFLSGPFYNQGANCSRPVTGSRAAFDVSTNKTYRTPGVKVPYGYYAWAVNVKDSKYNAPAFACSGGTLVKSKTVMLAASQRASYTLGQSAIANLNVKALPTNYNNVARATLYGPFSSAAQIACSPAKAVQKSVPIGVNKDGLYKTPSVRPKARGWYTWRLALPGSTFSTAAVTPCVDAAKKQTFQVK